VNSSVWDTYVLAHEHLRTLGSQLVPDLVDLLAADVIAINQQSLGVLVSVLEQLLPVLFLFDSLLRLFLDSH